MESIINTNNIDILKQILENSYNSIVITDANLDKDGPKILYVNRAFSLMTGYSSNDIRGKTPRILQGEKTSRATLDRLKEKCLKGEFFSGTTVNYKKDGTPYDVEWNISPLKDEHGNIVKYISIQKDITNEVKYKRDLEEKVKEQVNEIRRKDEELQNQAKLAAMGEMLDAVAHQWKQPIGIIKLNTEMIVYDFEDGLINEKYIKDFQEKVFAQLNHTTNTLDTFRDFLKPNTKAKYFNIEDILNKTFTLIKDEFYKQQIEIRTKIEDSYEIYGYENEFEHFILNILNNAKDAYKNLDDIEQKVIDIKVYENKNKKIIELTDYAGGIPKEVLSDIFKAHVTTKGETQGSGIGLYMTSKIIEKHNGKLEAYNHKSGATFKAIF
ncbi:MAG: PAS domain-containing sensor histidine kinase [Campylobacterota bacterium]